MAERYFPNPYTDEHHESCLNSDSSSIQLRPETSAAINQWIQRHIEDLRPTDLSDGTVYTGTAGLALLFMRLALLYPDQKAHYLSKAKALVSMALKRTDGRVGTFLCGAPGPWAVSALVSYHSNDPTAMNKSIEKIVSMKRHAVSHSTPDEHLYGRAGYLYTLMFLRKEIGRHVIEDQLVTEIFEAMIESGERYAHQSRSKSPLMYQWYDTEYLGAAHGLTGIVYLLLSIAQDPSFVHLRPYVQSHLIPTVDYLTSRQLPSGNYLSSNDSRSDKLVQWCHGAPGFVFVFVQAFKVTGNQSYLDRVLLAGDVVWQRGLLRKGYGLCHGVAGNAYVFLDLYQVTNDTKWLHRAIKFSEFCLDYGKHPLERTPDCPYSLFEGLAGTIYFMADLLHPKNARFPAFALD